MPKLRKYPNNSIFKCLKCGFVIGRRIYDNQVLELENGLLIFNWVRGECQEMLSSGRRCSKAFEWIAPALEANAGDISPDTIRDVLSAAKAQMTMKSERIKTREFIS